MNPSCKPLIKQKLPIVGDIDWKTSDLVDKKLSDLDLHFESFAIRTEVINHKLDKKK